jgi:uncharacterized protein YndB with AHSA1/START domain
VSREHAQEIEIRAPASAVWKALTAAEELTRWLAESAHVDSATGAEADRVAYTGH